MKRDISANLYQKCLILCSKILLIVLHNTGLTVLLPWQHNGFQTSTVLKAFLAPVASRIKVYNNYHKAVIAGQNINFVLISFKLHVCHNLTSSDTFVYELRSWKPLICLLISLFSPELPIIVT